MGGPNIQSVFYPKHWKPSWNTTSCKKKDALVLYDVPLMRESLPLRKTFCYIFCRLYQGVSLYIPYRSGGQEGKNRYTFFVRHFKVKFCTILQCHLMDQWPTDQQNDKKEMRHLALSSASNSQIHRFLITMTSKRLCSKQFWSLLVNAKQESAFIQDCTSIQHDTC